MLPIAVVSTLILVYTYFGYPVLVMVLSRVRPRRDMRQDFEPTVTVCMCVYNAASFIDKKLDSLLALSYPREKLDFLIYSDGCTDDTTVRVNAWARRDPRISLLPGSARLGKPTGLNQMRKAAQGEVLLLTDVRQELDAAALRGLISALSDPGVGCVSGELMLRGATGAGAYWRYEKVIRRAESKFRSVVGISGSIAAIRKADMPELPVDILLDDLWIPMSLRLQGRAVVFCEGAHAFDDAFEDDKEFPRKVRTLAGNFQIFARMPRLLLPFVNPSWFETMSHKVLRLVCPWALLALLASSLVGAAAADAGSLQGKTLSLLALGQTLFYTAAALGTRAGKLGSLGRTFVVLNAAALVGLWRFLGGRQKITW